MKTAFVILACEIAVLGVVVAAFLLNEPREVRLAPTLAATATQVRVPSSVPVSIVQSGATGRTKTAALTIHGGASTVTAKRRSPRGVATSSAPHAPSRIGTVGGRCPPGTCSTQVSP
jgi:hypothetical protein